ncbi:universal stress protein [Streptomyces exfoliatus]|uniref:universal stress protein n=1 Tax=Streptomyces exfoliatus TaxID=1905 RepID=UPI0004638150|nr:universal stress protein [Streptomyces exfoliatus]
MFRRVTVGVDGAPESGAAVEWAAQESLLHDVPLCLVHVCAWTDEVAAGVVGVDPRYHRAGEYLVAAAEELRRKNPSLEVSTRVLTGHPATALADEAIETDLLVMGSRGLSGVMGYFLGSVGMETVSATEQPVVFVRLSRHVVAPSGDIVVGLDIGRFCDPLLEFGFQEAARRGGRLLALHGWSIPPVVRDATALYAAQRERGPDVARRLAEILAPWKDKFPSVAVVERSPIGAPAQLLVRAAPGADLVVIGRRVRTASLGAHIGPVAHAVIHHCAAPVAVVAHH